LSFTKKSNFLILGFQNNQIFGQKSKFEWKYFFTKNVEKSRFCRRRSAECKIVSNRQQFPKFPIVRITV